MKQEVLVSGVSIGAIALCGMGWLALPSLQDRQQRVDAEAAVHLERARRLLNRHTLGLEQRSIELDRLAELGIDVEIEDASELLESAEDEYQQKHEELWEAFRPTDWTADPPRTATASYGNMARQIDEGVGGRDELIEKNQSRLDQALAEVESALSVSAGDASSRSYAEAKRLKSAIYYHMGLAEWLRAKSKRAQAAPYRRQLAAVAIDAGGFDANKSLTLDSGIDDQISLLHTALAEAEDRLGTLRGQLGGIDGKILDLETRIDGAKAESAKSRAALDAMRAEGVDFSDPRAAETFRDRFMGMDQRYREAERVIQSLTAGYYPNAEIDPTRDWLHGRYLENGSPDNLTIEPGLAHYRAERGVVASAIQEEEGGVERLRADIDGLVRMKEEYEEAQSRAADGIRIATQTAADLYAELNRVESEASAIEEEALDHLDRSARTASQAAGDTRKWAGDAQALLAGVSPDAKRRSAFKKRTESEWMRGYTAAQEADARIAKARIRCEQYESHKLNEALLVQLSESLPLPEADAADEDAKATEAREAGIDEATQAISVLEQAHRAAGGHWTIVAQEAGALYLLSRLGQSSYVDDAIEAYRNATKGREGEKQVEKIVARLRRLEAGM